MRTDAALQLRRFEDQYLPFPTFVAAKDAIEANMRLYRESGLARHMLVLGEAGTGKSSLCQWLIRQHPRRRLPEGDRIGALAVAVPPAATLGGMADSILEALGDPWADRGTLTAKTRRIAILCRACKIELLLLDEAQHFQDRGDARTHYLVGDWFKHLVDNIAVPTVLLGLPRLELLLQNNEQLRRRFSRRVRLALGQSDTESIETECLQLFLSLASLIDTPVSSHPYTAQEMGMRLFYACDGRVAYVKKLLFSALQRALEADHDVIDVPLLERAFVDEIWWEGVGSLNPFNAAFQFRRLDRRGEPFQHETKPARKASL
jgi:hypothetical protein